MLDYPISEAEIRVDSNYTFILRSRVEEEKLCHYLEYASGLQKIVKGKIIIDDNVNIDDYCLNVQDETLESKAYIILKDNYLKVFQKLFLVDDLYYEVTDSAVVISNSITTFGHKEICYESTKAFIDNGILPPRKTIFEGINRIEPGELVKVEALDGSIAHSSKWLTPYWLEYIENNSREILENKTLTDLIQSSIKESLVVKRPDKLSVLLSGGLDSGIIAFELQREKSIVDKISLTAWYDTEEGKNELQTADLRSKRFGFSHFPVLFNSKLFNEALEESFSEIDYPISDPPAILERFLVAEAMKRDSIYVFSGELADTLFGGGNTFAFERYVGFLRLFKHLIKMKSPDESYNRKIDAATSFGNAFDRQMCIWLNTNAESQIYEGFKELGSRVEDRLRLVSSFQLFTVRTQIDHSKIHLAKKGRDVFYSVPFENMRIAEYALALPARLKVHNLRNKYLLRHLYSKHLPGKKKKQSYSPPVYLWLDAKYIKSGYFPLNEDPVRYGKRGPEFGDRIWRHYILNRWYSEKYVGRRV